MARTFWEKIVGHYDCKPVAVYHTHTGEYLGDSGAGRSWWLGRWKGCGSLDIKGFNFDSNKHTRVKPVNSDATKDRKKP